MSTEMDDIISEFLAESEESLDRIDPLFVSLEKKGHDREILNEIFRCVHTLKGAAGFLGFQPVVDVAHGTESILKKLRDGEIALSKPLVDAVLRGVDALRRLILRIKAKEGCDGDVSPLLGDLAAALAEARKGGPAPSSGSPGAPGPAAEAPSPPGEPSGVPEGAPAAAENGGAGEDGAEKNRAARNLRVDVARIDKVLDLTGEVVLMRNRLLNIAGDIGTRFGGDPAVARLAEAVSFLDLVTTDMQFAVMRMRMQAIQKVFSKFPRLVRDVSASMGKEVDLRISGEDTEVDKSVIEQIGDPMVHIIRNAIDHGLETPEERRTAGKPPTGRISIGAFQKGSQIVIEVSDDGRGIDLDRVRRKAAERKLVSPEEAERMTDEAATNLIFLPGFSTAETSTLISGRGVGMDVVKTNIGRLGGFVEVRTARGAGTTFRISIPLTLAIIRTLMVRSGEAPYAIPLTLVEEIIRVSAQDVREVAGRRILVVRDRLHPLFELSEILGRGAPEGNGRRYAVVVAVGENRFCVAVDGLIGEEEAVIKPIGGLEAHASQALGATIRGDGKVVLILDLAAFSRNMSAVARTVAPGGGGPEPADARPPRRLHDPDSNVRRIPEAERARRGGGTVVRLTST